jgi:hypothetical protein
MPAGCGDSAAIRLGRESITEDLLFWWRDPPPFDADDRDIAAIAHARLADDRVTVEPLGLTSNGGRSLQSTLSVCV